MITLPPPVIVNTMFLVVIGFISLAGLRRLMRIECVARDKDDTLSRIEDTLFRCQKVLGGIRKAAEKTTEVHVDDTALLGAIDRVGREVADIAAVATSLYRIETILWFADGEGFSKTREYEFRPLIGETVMVDLGNGDDQDLDCLECAVIESWHRDAGDMAIGCMAGAVSPRCREHLLSGGWTKVADEEVDDVQGSDRGGDYGQGQGVPGRA